ncbi:endosomal/lysosomal proton channel TMEM175 isoform X1 [Hydra vulgaris]|uniref:Endosomal/lysosomal proton channel TMEM175 n=1 Tax=Hydra vulgaris TaxID=6087 RepID=T2M603_HYDVU|nr:endosomal/lysosomal potassium channel TMEM175 [Hydra vulgaris]
MSNNKDSNVKKNKLIRSRTKHKHLEEHYDDHLNEILPGNLHRGDIVSSNRMLAYSDAIMATCATFLVLPLRNLEGLKENQPLFDYVQSIHKEFIVFIIGFLIVLTIWENINIRGLVIKRVDDFMLTLVILEMLVTTILPYSLALQEHYPHEKVAIVITCSVLGVLQVIDIVIILYATHSPKMLHVDLKDWVKSDLRELTLVMIFRPLISLFILTLAGVLCLVHYSASWVFIAIFTFMPTIGKVYWFARRRMNKFEETEKDSFLFHFSKGNVSKERVEIMSDAVFAIVACILILDITVEEFPDKLNVNENSLNFALNHMKLGFMTFLGTFSFVSALWYINHTVLHLLKHVNSIIIYVQKLFLVLCCLCPIAANMLSHFASKGDHDSVIAIRFSALVVFLSSIANFSILLYGLLSKNKYMHDWASLEYVQLNTRQHLYTLVKSLNMPFWSLICILGTFGLSSAAPYVLYSSIIAALCTFFVSKFILMNHVGKTTASYTIRKTSSSEMMLPRDSTSSEDVLFEINKEDAYPAGTE